MDVAYGLVRCGHCRRVFDARANLREPSSSEEARNAVDALDTPQAAQVTPDDAQEAGAGADPMHPSSLAAPGTGSRWRPVWWAALVLAAVLLLVQIVNANRRAVAQVPVLGGAVSGLYSLAGRPIRPRLVLARYSLAGASLHASNENDNALELSGKLVNRAAFMQRVPLVRLELNDRYGRVMAERLLLPSDYGAATIKILDAGQAFRFHVLLADPGGEATGFKLVLCKRRKDGVVCSSS